MGIVSPWISREGGSAWKAWEAGCGLPEPGQEMAGGARGLPGLPSGARWTSGGGVRKTAVLSRLGPKTGPSCAETGVNAATNRLQPILQQSGIVCGPEEPSSPGEGAVSWEKQMIVPKGSSGAAAAPSAKAPRTDWMTRK